MMPTRKLNMGIVRKFFESNATVTTNTLATKTSHLGKLILACLLLAASASVFGADDQQKTLDFIDFKKLPDNAVEIRIALSDTAPNPTDFTSQNPARISLDLPGVNNNLPWSLPLPIDVGVAKNIKAVQAKGRTRVIVSVDKLVTYQLRTEDKNVFLTLSNSKESDEIQTAAATPEPAPKAEPTLVAAPAPAPKMAQTAKPAPKKKAAAKKGPA